MKQDPSFFDGVDPVLIYIARKLDEALAIECLLTAAGFDYGVEADRYSGGVLFPAQRVGAFFYVRPGAEPDVRQFLEQRGYRTPPGETELQQ